MRRSAPEQLRTERLLLRRPTPADAEDIYRRYGSIHEVTRYVSFPRHRSLADAEAFLDFSDMDWAAHKCGPYLVVEPDSGRLLGGTGLSVAGDEAETGYVFAVDAWGLGYATESLRAMIDLAQTLGLTALHARCHPDHHASVHVLEKCGFRLESRLHRALVFPNLSPGKQDVLTFVLPVGG